MDRLSVPEKLRDRVELLADCSTEEAIRDASLVVSRVGYNTAYTVIQTDVPIVFVPLPAPGQEQGYRARMLARLPDVSVIEEERPRAEEDLRVAIQRGLGSSPVVRELPFRIDGARGAADLLMEIADVKEKAVEASYC
jgi:predicted glycosyltransferase